MLHSSLLLKKVLKVMLYSYIQKQIYGNSAKEELPTNTLGSMFRTYMICVFEFEPHYLQVSVDHIPAVHNFQSEKMQLTRLLKYISTLRYHELFA